ncbi:ribonuclease HII [Bacillus cereus]|uniref:Ribonuclease n=1 Tax=Bacillus cereus TaxID=1396 RepID=A0A9X6SVT8_BACCE|nr:ribonuclease HII [Bacillus cereus]PDZ96015.1 ribonuclease HII [Bacillus cereus]PGP14736.1 ribonuclease HII [Bacillus cereus]
MIDKSFSENLIHESELLNQGYQFIAGVDEVGRGCFAGPVVAAAVIMDPFIRIPYLTDSKKIPKSKHNLILQEVKQHIVACNIAVVDAPTIDDINIRQATLKAMKLAVDGLKINPDYVLVDGSDLITNLDIPQKNVIQGDYYSHTISAASLIAKTYRDKLMAEYDESFGNKYEWGKNAGYPTLKHIELVKKHGLTPYHRKSWKTMKKI